MVQAIRQIVGDHGIGWRYCSNDESCAGGTLIESNHISLEQPGTRINGGGFLAFAGSQQ
ncbi:MAG: hypothetical protein JNL40_06375 [Cyclobacteriaceae bacterium]|nr:hypothetical protein [Cyclobacteriaceae bacterium]